MIKIGLFGKKVSKEEKDEKEIKEDERYKRVEELQKTKFLLCPHCNKEISEETGVIEYSLPMPNYAGLIGCPHCKKVIGATLEI